MRMRHARCLFWFVGCVLMLGGGVCRADTPQEALDLAYQTGVFSSPEKLTAFLTAHPEAAKAADRYTGFTLLHSAVLDSSEKKFELVRILLDRGADINAANKEGVTPLREVMRSERKEMGEFLLAKGAYLDIFSACALKKRERVAQLLQEDPKRTNARDENGRTPLWWALDADALDIARLLVAKGADVNAKAELTDHNSSQETPIFRSISGNRFAQVKFLIEQGADLNVRERNNGWTPLILANFYQRQPEIFHLLLEQGANPWIADHSGMTPLHYIRTAEDATWLLKYLAKVNARDKGGRTPLFTCQSKEIAAVLLEHGAAVNARAKDGTTPLFWPGSKETAEFLLAKGADLHALANDGSTPLHTAAGSMHPDLVAYLLAQGLDINARNKQGRIPLSYAISINDKAMVELLVARGADVKAKDAEGETPIHQIAPDTRQGKEIAAFLISRGAETDILAAIALGMTDKVAALLKADPRRANALTPQKRTALHLAAENGNKEIVALLLANGAEGRARDPYHYGATALMLSHGHKDVQELLQAWEKEHPLPPKSR